MRYAVVIEKAEGNYSGYVPDLPGCVATGARKSNAKSKRRFGFISTACVRMARKYLNHQLSASTWRRDGARRTGPKIDANANSFTS